LTLPKDEIYFLLYQLKKFTFGAKLRLCHNNLDKIINKTRRKHIENLKLLQINPTMSKINMLFVFIIIVCFFACEQGNTQGNNDKSLTEIKTKSSIADIVRNPVTAHEALDTINVAKMEFDETEFNFGTLLEGLSVEHDYTFTNTGKVPLVITDARSTCGCTVPVYPKDPVAPGEKGSIKVKFNSAGKKGNQSKPVTLTANTYPAFTKVFIKGYVHNPNAVKDSGDDHEGHDH